MNWVKIQIFIALFYAANAFSKNENNTSSLCDINNVSSVEVIYYPEYILTNVNINESRLDRVYLYKIEFNNIKSTPYAEEIKKILTLSFSKTGDTSDLRWGIKISSNKIFCSIYFDAFGQCGTINGEKACFSENKIIKWMKKKIPFFRMEPTRYK